MLTACNILLLWLQSAAFNHAAAAAAAAAAATCRRVCQSAAIDVFCWLRHQSLPQFGSARSGTVHSRAPTHMAPPSVDHLWVAVRHADQRSQLATFNTRLVVSRRPHSFGPPYYIFCPVISIFLLSFFPRLISAVGDWMSTILPHMVWP